MSRMETIQNAVDRTMQQHRHLCRLMHRGEILPWTTEEMGWQVAQLNPETVFVAEREGKACGVIIAAEVHGTLLLVRMLGTGGEWLRPLWRFVRLVCFQRKIAGVWMLAENQNDAERKLLQLLPRDFPLSHSEERNTILFAGRWNDAGTSSSPVVGSADNRNRSGDFDRHDGLRPGDRAWIALNAYDHIQRERAGAGGTSGTAESGGPGASREHPGADRRQLDADQFPGGLGEVSGAAVRSQLVAAVFGGQREQRREQCADLRRDDYTGRLTTERGRPEPATA
jgi:hypothetical protein